MEDQEADIAPEKQPQSGEEHANTNNVEEGNTEGNVNENQAEESKQEEDQTSLENPAQAGEEQADTNNVADGNTEGNENENQAEEPKQDEGQTSLENPAQSGEEQADTNNVADGNTEGNENENQAEEPKQDEGQTSNADDSNANENHAAEDVPPAGETDIEEPKDEAPEATNIEDNVENVTSEAKEAEENATEEPGEKEKTDALADEAPAEDTQDAVDESAAPAEESAAPAEESAAPAEESAAPAEESTAPVEESATVPAEESAPAEEGTVQEVENAVPVEESVNVEPSQDEAHATEGESAPAEKVADGEGEQEKRDDEPSALKEDQTKEGAAEGEGELDEKPAEDTSAPAEPAAEESQERTASPEVGKEEDERETPAEPVQVETDVSQIPPGSPKVAIEEKKSGVNLDATATVKFVLMPSGQVVTLACTLGQTLESLKTHFAFELKMPSVAIMLMFDGKSMPDSTLLADLGVGPNGTIQLEMQSADPVNTPIKPYRPRQEYHMPDVITVRVMTDDCEAKDVVVEIERSRSKKPYLGGFRNKNTGVEYHNASAQTMKKSRPPPTVERFCRDTQTCEQKNMRQQTTNTTSTQMTGVGVYVSNIDDKLLVPGKYFTADDHWSMILRNVIILQKYYRRWLAKRYVTQLKEDKARRLEWERQEELRKKREKEERIKRDYARRLNPKTKADFDMLLHCLEKWRQEEMERIDSTLTGAERKAALCMLLDQETELLSAIERHKNEAYEDNKDKTIMAFLDKAAAPKKWQGHDGKLTYMDTPFTIRAKELRDIFNSINMKYLTQDERLDVLLTLKHTVKEHDCKLTQEIIELIDREADLLMRGVKEGNLTGLRKRISTLFLQYIKTPTFNPEAARLLKVPQDPSTLRKNINYCHSCGNYLPSTDFFITSNSKHVGRCRRCVKIENDGRQREDHTFYRVMLKTLRKSEEAMQDGSSICFLLQEHDLRYLVENIWSNQSVLSAWDDLYDLVLVRWDKHQEWSPWNCILLTHDEAEAHKKLFSLEEGYGHVFIHKVTQKHNFARNYFSRLPGMAELLRQKLGNRDLSTNNGPSVSGQPIPKAQKV